MTFHDNLRFYREKRGYSSLELAKLLSIPYTTYKGYENQGREPKYAILCKMADILNVSLDDLLGHLPENEDEKIVSIINNSLNKSLDLFNDLSKDVHISLSNLDDNNIFFTFRLKGVNEYTIPIDKNFIVNKIKDLTASEEIRKEKNLRYFILDSVFCNTMVILINVIKLKLKADNDTTAIALADEVNALRLAKEKYLDKNLW